MNIQEYFQLVSNEMKCTTELRYGQIMFNILYDIRPDLSEKIRGNSKLDPFYFNDGVVIDNFVEWLYKSW